MEWGVVGKERRCDDYKENCPPDYSSQKDIFMTFGNIRKCGCFMKRTISETTVNLKATVIRATFPAPRSFISLFKEIDILLRLQ